ncbi:DNA mismatch repair protein Msh2-like protein, partial [Dinothrombium tinctorium]
MDTDAAITQLDIPAEAEFIKCYHKLEEKSDLTFRFFDHKDFFTVHGNDASFIAEHIIRTQNVIRYIGSEKLASVAISANKLDSILRELLIIRRYRIEFYEKADRSWKLRNKCSPGNLGELEELIYSNSDCIQSHGLLSIKVATGDDTLIGLAYIDTFERCLFACEFADNRYYTTFEALLVQLGPQEVIISENVQNSSYFKQIDTILHLNNILVTKLKSQMFNIGSFDTEMKRIQNLLHPSSKGVSAANDLGTQKLAVSAIGAIFKFLNLSDDESYGQYMFHRLKIDSFMRLDSSVITSLNLFSNLQNNSQHKSISSLYSLLNNCKTAAGKRLLSHWIRQPLTDLMRIDERLDLVEHFFSNAGCSETLSENFL